MRLDPIIAKLIADLIRGFQKQVIALQKDGLLLGDFLHKGRRLRWLFSAPNLDNPDEGGGFFVEMRVIPAVEIADKMGNEAEALLRQVDLLDHDWDESPAVWVEQF